MRSKTRHYACPLGPHGVAHLPQGCFLLAASSSVSVPILRCLVVPLGTPLSGFHCRYHRAIPSLSILGRGRISRPMGGSCTIVSLRLRSHQ